jgi:transcriptional regulator CtsR
MNYPDKWPYMWLIFRIFILHSSIEQGYTNCKGQIRSKSEQVKQSEGTRYMSNLANLIERYIKSLMESAQHDVLELQRHELARQFDCVPSQINYVLATRFTIDRGYIVESKRGGGGFIRIVRISLNPNSHLLDEISKRVGDELTAREMDDILYRLNEAAIVSDIDIAKLKMTMARGLAGVPKTFEDAMRARMFNALISLILNA